METIKEWSNSWRLLKALQDKDKFTKLSLDEKLEAFRLYTIQRRQE